MHPAEHAKPLFEAPNPGFVARVQASFARQRIMALLGAALERIEPGECEIRLPFKDDLCQQHGLFHGGVIGTIADSAGGYALFLSIAILGADMTLSPSWAFCIDIGRSHAGTVSGTMNMAGNLAAFATTLAFPYIEKWAGTTTPYFLIAAALNLVAIVIWLMARPDKPLEVY